MTQWLSVPQAAKEVGVDRTTFWRWVQAKQVTPAGYVGRYPVFSVETVQQIKVAYAQQKAA